MNFHRYAMAPKGEFIHILRGRGMTALCGNTGRRVFRPGKVERSYWFVLATKCPGPIPSGRQICVKCEEAMRG